MMPGLRLVLGAALVLVGAQAEADGPQSAGVHGPATEARTTATLVVYSGGHVKPVLERLVRAFEEAAGVRVAYESGPSGKMLDAAAGGQADVYVAADLRHIRTLEARDLVAAKMPLAHHRLAIVVRQGNPKSIRSLADLARPGIKVYVEGPEGCQVGTATRWILAKNAIRLRRPAVTMNAESPTLRNVTEFIKAGLLEAAIVWDSMAARLKGDLDVVEIPAEQNVAVNIAAVVLRSSRHHAAAERLILYLTNDQSRQVWAAHGFIPGPCAQPAMPPEAKEDRKQDAARTPDEPRDTWIGVERVVAVGDVHGDHEQFLNVLRAAEVVDEKGNWIAGKAHLVQIGDVLDRGPDSRKAMDLLMRLERQAAKAGGAVHALIGNHEAMILLGDWRYVSAGELKAFGGAAAYRRAMSRDGSYGRWIRSHNAVVKINDLVFVHAGITPAFAGMSLAEINGAVREQLEKGEKDGIATDGRGPLWDRSLALGEEGLLAERLDAVLKRYGARRMVIGHTVCPDGVVTAAGGRLVRIDVGMSAAYGGPAACLVVEKGVLYEVRHPAIKRRLEVPASRPSGSSAPSAVRSGTSRVHR